jgi:hypothetical protein
VESDSFGHIATHKRSEQRWLVGDSYDKVALPLLKRVPSRLADELLTFWEKILKASKDPRAFWRPAWDEEGDSLRFKVDACADRQIARLAANPRTRDGLLGDLHAIQRWCANPVGVSVIAETRETLDSSWSDTKELWAAIDPAAAVAAWPHLDLATFEVKKFLDVVEAFLTEAQASVRRVVAGGECGLLTDLPRDLKVRLAKAMSRVNNCQMTMRGCMYAPGRVNLRDALRVLKEQSLELTDVFDELAARRSVFKQERANGERPRRGNHREASRPAVPAPAPPAGKKGPLVAPKSVNKDAFLPTDNRDDWISSSEIRDKCGIVTDTVLMAAKRRGWETRMHRAVKWYKRTDIRAEWGVETKGLI